MTITPDLMVGFVLGLLFFLLFLDNVILRKKVYKLYERLIMEGKKKSTSLDYDKILKETK